METAVTRQEFGEWMARVEALEKQMADNAPSKAELRERDNDRHHALHVSHVKRGEATLAAATKLRADARAELIDKGIEVETPCNVAGYEKIGAAISKSASDVEVMVMRGQLRQYKRGNPDMAMPMIRREDLVGVLLDQRAATAGKAGK